MKKNAQWKLGSNQKLKIGYLWGSGRTIFKISAAIPPVATPELKIFLNNSGKCSKICGTWATPKPSASEIAIIKVRDDRDG